MSYYDVYIGTLPDPDFPRDDGDRSSNVLHRKSPFFPLCSLSSGPFADLINLIDASILEGKQTDWGGRTARASKRQIQEFVAKHCTEKISTVLRSYIDNLDPKGTYALVACET